jgi:murein DD-endopeptidase MepM/ murein hydrolase activator NlpD
MKSRKIFWLGSLIGFLLCGWYGYTYFCDAVAPHITILGIEDNGYYAGDLVCLLTADKNGFLTLQLDGTSISTIPVSRPRTGEYQFVLPAPLLPDGKHTIIITFSDNTYHRNKAIIKRTFTIDNVPLKAALVTSDLTKKISQGHTFHLQVQTNKPLKIATVQALSKEYPCVPESAGATLYESFIPIMCEEQPNDYLISVDFTDHVGNTIHLDTSITVVAYPFKKQSLHIDPEKLKLEQESGAKQKELEELIAEIVQQSPQEKLWRGSFCAPTEIQRISCDFGTIRTTQHKGRYAHKAVDLINTPRSVVWAPQNGRVALKARFAASGNTVVLDHGCGIISMLFHLEDFADINVGELVTQGAPIGTLGKTGFATGYHLHWEMRVANIPVDPLEWTTPLFWTT